MTTPVMQNSYISGEISPSVLGRTDRPQYRNGATTMRNMFVRYTGGASSRAGLAYCLMSKQAAPNVGGTPTSNPPRIIEFQFSINQGFALEFGDQYMRILSQGAYVTEASKNITSADCSNPANIQIIAHGYKVGDWIFIQGMGGLTFYNGLVWIVTNIVDVNTINVSDLFGVVINGTMFTTNYTSGGTAARLYTVVSPYAAIDLPYLKFTQSANTMSLCCINQQTLTDYPTYNLQRISNTNWQFNLVNFGSSIGPPSFPVSGNFVATNSTTKNTLYGYVITAVSSITGEESIASPIVGGLNNDISINAGSNTMTWNAVPNAESYNIYACTPIYQGTAFAAGIPFGFIGTATGTTFTDTNIVADFTTTPPLHNNPFSALGITDVVPVNGGSGYTAANIGYHINTSTGSGFSGTPTVNGAGQFSGFTISSEGENFQPTDTITITSGSAGAPTAATGTWTLVSQPAPAVAGTFFNGVSFRFSTDVVIGSTTAITVQNVVAFLNASTNPLLTIASYSSVGNILTVTYKTAGTVGNSYTLSSDGFSDVIVSGATLSGGMDGGAGGGSGATAVLVFGSVGGNNPSVVEYYQQRIVYANTINQPDTYFFSKPGAPKNMDSAIPTIDSDAIIGTPWAQQINGIQFFQPTINGLLTFTGNGVWNVSGGNSLAITPSDQNAQAQAQVGCSATVPPLYVNLHVLYVQSKNSIVRDVAYNFIYNVFQGTDITLWSSHLFQNYSILQWAYAEEPFKLIWTIRNDGTLLSLIYLKEEEIEGWSRHDTNGLFISTCTVTEKALAATNNPSNFGPLVDAPYFITQRYIKGQNVWVYYSERMDDRNWSNIEDCFCVDAGLTWPMAYPQAVLSPAAATGNNVIFNASSSVFTAAMIGSVIRADNGKATIISQTGTACVANITQPLTITVPNDPNNLPVPVPAGEWSVSVPTSVVTGLNHLEGMTVTGLADGGVITPVEVVNGTLTLTEPASAIVIGLPYLVQLQTPPLDVPSQTTTQGRRKNLSSVILKVENSRGFSVGANMPDSSLQPNNAILPWVGMQEYKQRNASVSAGTAVPLFSGETDPINITSDWDPLGQLAVMQSYPMPLNALAAIPQFALGDPNG